VNSLESLVVSGARIAVADGVGTPRAAFAELSKLAREVGDISLVLGWHVAADPALELDAFRDVRALMAGWGVRRDVDAGRVHYVPGRLSAATALLQGPLRPDVLLCSVVPAGDGWSFGAEESWLRAAVDAGAAVVGVVNHRLPRASAEPALHREAVTVVGECELPPLQVRTGSITSEHECLGRQVAALVPEGARLQVGPGPLGAAVLAALTRPVGIDSGMLVDGVVDLQSRGLLAGTPVCTYLSGTDKLYEWAHGRPMLRRLETTHDPVRLTAHGPFISVNTALEIDLDGQVNVEGTAASAVGGIGGHPDYALAGSRSASGLSLIAVPRLHAGASTLVKTLSRPVSTPSYDIDVVVTEAGSADLRGLSRQERRRALRHLWEA